MPKPETPPGQDPNRIPPGQDPNWVPPGQRKDKPEKEEPVVDNTLPEPQPVVDNTLPTPEAEPKT